MTRLATCINLDLAAKNDSTEDKKCSFIADLSSANIPPDIISQYDVEVARFSIDVSHAPICRLQDEWVELQVHGCLESGEPAQTYSGRGYLLNHDEWPIFSTTEYLENINRAFQQAHHNLLENHFTDFKFENQQLKTFSPTDSTIEYEINQFSGIDKTANIVVELEPQSTDLYANEDQMLVDILLEKDGRIVTLASTVNITGKTTIREDFRNLPIDENRNVSGNIAPTESLVVFHNTPPDGTWALHVRPSLMSGSSVTIDVKFSVTAQPTIVGRFSIPHLAPRYSDDDNGTLNLNCSDDFVKSAIRITASQNLMKIIQIGSLESEFVQYSNQVSSAQGDSWLTIPALRSRRHHCVSLYKMLVRNEGQLVLPRDYTNETRSPILTSYVIPTDHTSYSLLEFYSNNSYRKYSMASQTLYLAELTVALLYRDGSVHDLYLSPGAISSIFLNFTLAK